MNDLCMFAKTFTDPTRVRVIAALRRSELCVCELSDAMEMSQSTLSTHLQVIRRAGLVATRRDGKWIYYGIEPTQAQLVEALFCHYKSSLDVDKRLARDADRLEQRLAIRENGRCLRGFAQLNAMIKEVKNQ